MRPMRVHQHSKVEITRGVQISDKGDLTHLVQLLTMSPCLQARKTGVREEWGSSSRIDP